MKPSPDHADRHRKAITHVLNCAVSWVAALQVAEAFKILMYVAGEFKLHALDIWTGTSRSVHPRARPDYPCCGQRRFEFLEAARGS